VRWTARCAELVVRQDETGEIGWEEEWDWDEML
jgi:hypothetical protein